MSDARLTLGEQLRQMTAGDVLQELSALCRKRRLAAGLSYEQAAKAIGLPSKSMLHRLENGGEARLSTVRAVVRWLEGWV